MSHKNSWMTPEKHSTRLKGMSSGRLLTIEMRDRRPITFDLSRAAQRRFSPSNCSLTGRKSLKSPIKAGQNSLLFSLREESRQSSVWVDKESGPVSRLEERKNDNAT